MKKKKVTKDNRYSYPLKIDENLKEPLIKKAKANRRKINDEINIAIQMYLGFIK